jgi:hypothetical protein
MVGSIDEYRELAGIMRMGKATRLWEGALGIIAHYENRKG